MATNVIYEFMHNLILIQVPCAWGYIDRGYIEKFELKHANYIQVSFMAKMTSLNLICILIIITN